MKQIKGYDLRQNTWESYDGFINLGYPTFEGEFWDIGRKNQAESKRNEGESVFEMHIGIDSQLNEFEREVYNLIDLLGDLGGVLEILVMICGVFLFPVSEFKFILKAFELLYIAKSSDSNLFKDKTNEKVDKKDYHPIKLSSRDMASLFCSLRAPSFAPSFCSTKLEYKKLYKKGLKKIDKEFQLEKILKNLRNLKIIVK